MWLSAPVARLFVAAWPPPSVVQDLARHVPRSPAAGVRWVPPENWHVTLRFLGSCDPEAAAAALAAVEAPAAEAAVGPAVTTLGRVLCLPVSGLDELAEAVRAATARVGQPPDPRPFTGHLTLARLRNRRAAPGAGARFSASFAVDEVLLVESDTRPDGAVYRAIGSRRLPPDG